MRTKMKIKAGDRYGMLTIIREVEPYYYKGKLTSRKFECRCDCGNTTITTLNRLRQGRVKSCGCLIGKSSKNNGQTNTRLYRIWTSIKQRCYYPKVISYKRYGGRGIIVCDEWLKNFDSFYIWAINNGYSDGLTIDRIDYNGIYEPSNCRWVDYITQGNNRSTNVLMYYNGEEHTIAEWSRILNISQQVIYNRKKHGWKTDKILSTPVRNLNKSFINK